MIKLIASDMDGTLLLHGAQSLNPEVYTLVRALKDKGIHFVAASGRQLASLKSLFAPIVNEISYIAENGAVCVYNNEEIYSSTMEKDLAARIIQGIKEHPVCEPVVSSTKTCYIKNGNEDLFDYVKSVLKNDTSLFEVYEDICEPIVKIAAYAPTNFLETAAFFKESFSKEVNVITAGNEWVDFMPYGTNKGHALQLLLDQLGILPEEVMVFGDQENDVEMLRLAGISYAMSTAYPHVKACAMHTTDTVEEVLRALLETL